MFKSIRALSKAAYARLAARAGLQEVGPLEMQSATGLGLIVGSVLGLLTPVCAYLSDVYLLAAPIAFIASLAATSSVSARFFVPLSLVVVDVCVSVQRALARDPGRASCGFTPHGVTWSAIVVGILGIQLSAGIAEWLALDAAHPSTANTPLLLFLILLALASHAAALLLSGESLLLLTSAWSRRRRRTARRKLLSQLQRQTLLLVQHYSLLGDQHRAGELRLDPVVENELCEAGLVPASGPTEPAHDEPSSPYDEVNNHGFGCDFGFAASQDQV